ncbi:hypothetical protein [Pantoea dispersa]|uniref:hypothetical protein n=1 Tax=Pantoea dispersa TaxID=59814 RepID=UPI003D161144
MSDLNITTNTFSDVIKQVPANRWIEHQQYFRDITPDHGNNRVFHLFNPNGPY